MIFHSKSKTAPDVLLIYIQQCILKKLFTSLLELDVIYYFSSHCRLIYPLHLFLTSKIVSEYDQEIPQSQTADNPVEPRGRAAQPSRDTRKTN